MELHLGANLIFEVDLLARELLLELLDFFIGQRVIEGDRDLLRNFDHLTLSAESRQYLDETKKEYISGNEKEKKEQRRCEETAGKVPSAGEHRRK